MAWDFDLFEELVSERFATYKEAAEQLKMSPAGLKNQFRPKGPQAPETLEAIAKHFPDNVKRLWDSDEPGSDRFGRIEAKLDAILTALERADEGVAFSAEQTSEQMSRPREQRSGQSVPKKRAPRR